MLRRDDDELVLADIPGLIEGASKGAGLGTRFLGHVERCRMLLHLIDGVEEDPLEAYRTVRHEVETYGQGLADKQELIALNKCDAMTAEEAEDKRQALEAELGQPVAAISAVAGLGIDGVVNQLFDRVQQSHVEEAEAEAGPRVFQP